MQKSKICPRIENYLNYSLVIGVLVVSFDRHTDKAHIQASECLKNFSSLGLCMRRWDIPKEEQLQEKGVDGIAQRAHDIFCIGICTRC